MAELAQEWWPLVMIATFAFMFTLGYVFVVIRDRHDQRLCRRCGKRKVDNSVHYDDEAIWGHDFEPHTGDNAKTDSAAVPAPTEPERTIMTEADDAKRYDKFVIVLAHEIVARHVDDGQCNTEALIVEICDALQAAENRVEAVRVRARYAEDKYRMMREIAEEIAPTEVAARLAAVVRDRGIEHPMPGDYSDRAKKEPPS